MAADELTPGGRRVVVLLNVGAGTADEKGADHLRDVLAASFAANGVEAELHFCAGPELNRLADEALARAKSGSIDAVVAGGGDGSISTVASALAGSGVPLGVLPLGTLNHFAKDLGLPAGLEDAVQVIATGGTRLVDLAEVNGELFINNSSIGIYPYIVLDRDRRRAQHNVAKWMAMVPAFFRMMKHFPQRRLALSAEGWTRPYRTPCLFVGNNAYGMDLFTLGRREHLDRGELYIHVVKQRRPFGFFWMICRLCFGHADNARDIESFKVKEATVRSRTSRLPVALDGEVMFMHPPLHYRSRPKALRVIVPSGA